MYIYIYYVNMYDYFNWCTYARTWWKLSELDQQQRWLQGVDIELSRYILYFALKVEVCRIYHDNHGQEIFDRVTKGSGVIYI